MDPLNGAEGGWFHEPDTTTNVLFFSHIRFDKPSIQADRRWEPL